MTDYRYLTVELDEGVAVVTLNRPPVNALSPDLIAELTHVADTLAEAPGARAVLFRSAIPGQFIAGADIASGFAPQEGESPEQAILRRIEEFQRCMDRVEALPLPTVAAISGHCLGGGLEFALACDYRLMADDGRSKIGLPETRLGIFPAAGGTQRLWRVVGWGRAVDMILRGLRLTAAEAASIGLVHEAVPPDRLEARARELARELAAGPTRAFAEAKRALRIGFNEGIEAGLQAEREGFARCLRTEDAAEGISAFFQRRQPQFKGR